MKKSGTNFLKIFATAIILTIFLNFSACITFKSVIDESLLKVLNPGPEVTGNPIGWIKDGRIEDRTGNEIYLDQGIVVNEAFMTWVWDMKTELAKLLKGEK